MITLFECNLDFFLHVTYSDLQRYFLSTDKKYSNINHLT
nr:MAG TPA: hypothetical protein [Caudoviricetes sp.]